ncbi:MAG TPA: hypothetical protein VFF65_05265 [Phycisphaerales bacterium]|nr:hypothetical protein [Phycisphaerales bacterium]
MSGYELSSSNKDCPACTAQVPVAAVMCTRCGLNFQTGLRTQEAARGEVDTVARAPAKPQRNGAAAPKKKAAKLDTREERRAATISDYWRSTRRVCIAGTVVGVALTFGIGIGARQFDALQCLIYFGLCEFVLFVSAFAIGYFFIGFEEDVRGLVMRLVGVGAVWAGTVMLITMIPALGVMMFVGIAAMIVTSLALLLHLMTDREWADSLIISVAAWALFFAISLTFAAMAA